ncbi:hypothetical protein DSM112329_05395 [Paraconexibacter sp. AEG42_29]|uniref:Mce/MlaD domain-containing protein n=2 Tax=Paraconexibacter sp. AEG42_29 TaxID=2997339 RepID=A0AAU7B3P2_9ACTN
MGALVAVAVAVLATIVLRDDEEQAHIRMVMPSALGLRDGSGVRLGGVLVGKVSDMSLTDDDQVKIDLSIDDKNVRLGSDASVTVKSLNLLGEKYAALDPGDVQRSPVTDLIIPAKRVTSATDLDQVLDVLDADTRTRLAILVNEAGVTMTGRHADFNALLGKLPPALDTATKLLNDVVSDNRTLADLIQHSDRFLARTVRQSADLGGFIDEAADAATTFAARSDALRATLRKSPGGLSTLRAFLADLRTTAAPLGAAARNISATSPELERTLREVEPFRSAARPTLRQAQEVAPTLTRLGREATPVVKDAVPTLKSLDTFAKAAVPLTQALGVATPDLLGVLEGWGRAIQGRDGRGHAFHGGVTFGAGILQTLLEPPTPEAPAKAKKQAPAAERPTAAAPALPPTVKDLLPKVTDAPKKLLDELPKKLKELPKAVTDALESLTGLPLGRTQGDTTAGSSKSVQSVLDYLLKP